jgi:hypothetical protein
MTAAPRSDTHLTDTLRLWSHVFGDSAGTLGVFAGYRATPDAKKLERTTQRFFTYPIAADNAADWLYEEDARGFETYFCAHLLTNRRRIKANAAPVRALWVDGDGAQVPDDIPRPTAIVESSPGRHHFYWRLTRWLRPTEAEALCKRLAYALGADKSGWDLSQLLRPPDTHHHGSAVPQLVKLVNLRDDAQVDPDDLDRLLPPLTECPRRVAGEPWDAATAGSEPPVRLSEAALRVWCGEDLKGTDDGKIDRSKSLFWVGAVLWDANAAPAAIAAALAERDATLGWHCYTNRPEEYTRIATKLAEGGSAPTAPPENLHARIGNSDDPDEYESELLRLLANRDGAIATLQRERAEARELLSLTMGTLHNASIALPDRLTAGALVNRIRQENDAVGLPFDAPVRIVIAGEKDANGNYRESSLCGQLGLKEGRVRLALKRIKGDGYIDYTVTREPIENLDPLTGELTPAIDANGNRLWRSIAEFHLREQPLICLRGYATHRRPVASNPAEHGQVKPKRACREHGLDASTTSVTACGTRGCERMIDTITKPGPRAFAGDERLNVKNCSLENENTAAPPRNPAAPLVDRCNRTRFLQFSAPPIEVGAPRRQRQAKVVPLTERLFSEHSAIAHGCEPGGGPTAVGRPVCIICQGEALAAQRENGHSPPQAASP